MKTTVLIAAFLFSASLAQGQGKEVVVAFGWQGILKGELVAVRDTSIVVAAERDEGELMTIPVRDVRWVLIRGRNTVPAGSVIGLLGGAVTGAFIGVALAGLSNDDGLALDFRQIEQGFAGAGIGALAGMAIGYGIGSATSSKDVTVEPEDINFKQVLFPAARNSRGRDWGTR